MNRDLPESKFFEDFFFAYGYEILRDLEEDF